MLIIDFRGERFFGNSLHTGKGDKKMRKRAREWLKARGAADEDLKKYNVHKRVNEFVTNSHNL